MWKKIASVLAERLLQRILTMQLSVLGILSIFIVVFPLETVLSDGLFEEKLPPASLGNRQLSLFTKINPPILSTDTENRTKYLQLELFDADSNRTIPHVYYFISVSKDNDLLMKELFHSHEGGITININSSNEKDVKNFGDREPLMGAWIGSNLNGTNQGNNISIQAPILNEAGLYDLNVDIFGIDNDTNRFKAINSLTFDSGLSVGEISKHSVDYLGEKSNLTIISYYDKVQNFSFSQENGSFTWDMPFDWDIRRFKGNQSILVHQEVKIPKTWIANSTDSFVGEVNGVPQVGRAFVLDPFSSQGDLTIHYILSSNDLARMANDSKNVGLRGDGDMKLMRFELNGVNLQSD
jgi:hypothetical protein